ncbi:PP2C family protein-serine/threonine phosphatase [Pirellulaceae bacterium SH449]
MTKEPVKTRDTNHAWFSVASATHVGMRRRNNQDNHAVLMAPDGASWEKFGHMLIVADGMGAHAAGELASQLAVEHIPLHYRKLFRGSSSEALELSMIETNAEIFRRGQANPEFRSMGTTACAVTIVPEGAIVAHVGDSRVYRLRGNHFEQLTFDHSLVWEMRATGDISEEAIRNSTIPKNVITRSLGPNPSVVVDIEGPYPLQVGDKFLLCSDGLSGQLGDEELGTLLMLLDIDTAVQAMVDIANLRGGPDNITVVIGEVRSLDGIPSVQPAKPTGRATGGKANHYPIGFAVTASVGALLSVVLLLLGHFPMALVSMVASLVAFGSGWAKFRSTAQAFPSFTSGHGKGPYRQYRCKADSGLASNLDHVVEELKNWFKDNDWPPPPESIAETIRKSKEAANTRNYASAIQFSIQAILELMELARMNQHKEEKEKDAAQNDDDDDGVIDY